MSSKGNTLRNWGGKKLGNVSASFQCMSSIIALISLLYSRSHVVDCNVQPDWPGRQMGNWEKENIFFVTLLTE